MAASPSDISTFKSALKKENMPDFTITCGNYGWKVHSRLFAKHSKAFKAVFEEGATNTWVSNDAPVIVAHLILWCYTCKYGDLAEEAMENDNLPPEIEIDELMKHGFVRPPRADGSSQVVTEEDALFMPADKEWVPESLHAKMYVLATKYGLARLKDKAALEIEVMLTELDFEKSYFLPLVGELFGVKSGEVGGDLEKNGRDGEQSNGTGSEVQNTTAPVAGSTPDASEGDPGDTKPPTPSASRSASFSPVVTAEVQVLSPENDAKLWSMLADEAAHEFDRYQHEPVFQDVMKSNPQFNWEVTCRMQKKFADMAKEMAKKDAVITGLEGEKTKGKKGRKRKEKEMSAS